MVKFSLEFNKEVSEKYLEDELSLKSVARMYDISPCTVRKWAYANREHRIGVLTGKKGRYSAGFKLYRCLLKYAINKNCEVSLRLRMLLLRYIFIKLNIYIQFNEDKS